LNQQKQAYLSYFYFNASDPKGIIGQLISEILKRYDINAIFCFQYGTMRVNNDPTPQSLKPGNGT